jgi:Kef-type K+ transport system membrane component KefB
MEPNQKKKLYDMLPVITFIVSYFIFQLFDWMDATQFLFAMLVSILTYAALVSDFKEEDKDKRKHKRLNFYIGILTLVFFVMIGIAIIHWNRWIPSTYRMVILFLDVLVFFIVMFRAIRVLSEFKAIAEKS